MRVTYDPLGRRSGEMLPSLSMILIYGNRSVQVTGFVDTGATVNVLPYTIGLQLGAGWDEDRKHIRLAGNLGAYGARGMSAFGYHPELNPTNPVELVFAWTRAENVPVIFGQTNFFMEFDVCFYGSVGFYEVNLKATE